MTLPPHSPESEAALMGCLLLDPNCLDAVVQAGLQSDWLYDGKHRTLLEAIGSLMDQGKAVDVVTVGRWLVDSGRSHEIGLADLSTLMDSTPSATNWPHYLEPIKACFIRRSIIRACQDVLSDAASGQCSPDQLISSAESAIDRCRVGVVDTAGTSNRAVMARFLEELQARSVISQTKGGIAGIPTGFPTIDQATCGLMPGELCIIGARPGVGKTALGLNIATNAAIREGIPTLFLTAEMSTSQLMGRVIGSWARVDNRLIRSGQICIGHENEQARRRMLTFTRTHADAKMHWEDIRGRKDIDVVASIVRSYVRKHGVQLVMVDYLQLLTAKRGDNRAYEIGEVSEGLKNIAVRCNVALVAMAQINRDSDKGEKPRAPKLSDLKDSGSIEQAGEVIMFIHRDKEKDHSKATLYVAKMRDGGQISQPLYYDGAHFTFHEQSKIEEVQ
jgi:replicative DNA helicase